MVPTQNPQLQRTTYIMILDSFLSEPEDHDILSDIIKAWPSEVYDYETFTQNVLREIEMVTKSSPKKAKCKLPAPLLQEVAIRTIIKSFGLTALRRNINSF